MRRADRAHGARHRGSAGPGPPSLQSPVPDTGGRDVVINSHDPLTVLSGDDPPVSPDPAFAARLRARLESALTLPDRTEGVDMSGTETAIAELNEPAAVAAPTRSAVVAYLTVPDA